MERKSITHEIFEKLTGYKSGKFKSENEPIHIVEIPLKEVSKFTNYSYYWDGSMGSTNIRIRYYAIMNNGEVIDLEGDDYTSGSNYAYESSEEYNNAKTPIESWNLMDVKYIVRAFKRHKNWSGSASINEDGIDLIIIEDGNKNTDKWNEIQERCQKRMKSAVSADVILKIAALLDVL